MSGSSDVLVLGWGSGRRTIDTLGLVHSDVPESQECTFCPYLSCRQRVQTTPYLIFSHTFHESRPTASRPAQFSDDNIERG